MKKVIFAVLLFFPFVAINSVNFQSVFANTEYHLQFNLAKNNQGEWVDDCAYMHYGFDNTDWDYGWTTCYPYAIERALLENQFGYSLYDCCPGDISSNSSSSAWQTVEDVVNLVVEDLQYLNYDVSYSTHMPLSIGEQESVICVRTTSYLGGDFHFMRLDMIGDYLRWTQKFLGSAPLLCLYEPEDMPWSIEYAFESGANLGGLNIYTSSVYYIVYGHSSFYYSEGVDSITINSVDSSFVPQNIESLSIPENINGKPVTTICAGAFSSLGSLNSVLVPELINPIIFGVNVFSSANPNLKIFVPENQFSNYQNQIDLNPYLNKIIPYFYDNSRPVYLSQEMVILSGNEIGEWSTYYDDDDISNGVGDGFLMHDELYVVTILNSYYAYCLLDEIFETNIFDVSLEISLDSFQEGMEVFLLDENAQYVDTYEVTNGYLEIDLTSLINDEMSSFILYPANSNTYIAFLPEDVQMCIRFNVSVEIELS